MQTKVIDSDNRVDLIMPGTPGAAIIESTNQELTTAKTNRQAHINNMERWYKKRYGVRPRVQTWPWRNAANLHLPLVDKMIRRAKPKYIRLAESVNPMVTLMSVLLGDDLSLIRAVEREFDSKMRFDMQIIEKISLGVDKMIEKGYFLAKVVQEFAEREVEEVWFLEREPVQVIEFMTNDQVTDDEKAFEIAARFGMDIRDDNDTREIRKAIEQVNAGRTEIKFKRTVELHKFPSLYIRDPRRVVVPADTMQIQNARMIRDMATLMLHQVEANGISNVWNKRNVAELLNRLSKDETSRDRNAINTQNASEDQVQLLEDRREGISPTATGLQDFNEDYIWFKWPGDRLPSRSVLTTHADNPDLPLRFIKYPYLTPEGDQDLWPFAQVRFEMNSERFYSSRGLPQMLDSLQTEITNNHNAKQNQMSIANNLNIKARRNSNITTSWIPGQPLWVNRMDDVEELNLNAKDVSYDREEQVLKSWAEEYAGLVDAALSGPNSLTEPRTKFEIEQVVGIQNDVAFGDVTTFQIGMRQVYQMIWNRFMQYGDRTIRLMKSNGEIADIAKDELARRFKLIPTGNLGNSSQEQKKRDAGVRLQAFRGDPRINQDELYKDFLINDDERLAERLLIPGAQVQQQQVRKQIEEIQRISMGYTEVPELSDDDAVHIKVIDDFLQDPKKRRNFNEDRLEALMLHRQAHIVAQQKKQKATDRGGRIQQEIAQIAQGNLGRQSREAPVGS